MICLAIGKRGHDEYYIKDTEDMYETSKATVRTPTSCTKEFHVDVGIHQGPALTHFLFIVILYVLTECIGTGPPNVLERHGLNVWKKEITRT